MNLTPFADVNRMLALLRVRIKDVLGSNLVGLYLTGSLVTGDFQEDVSDIDLLAVTARDLALLEIDQLEAMHHDIARNEPTWDNRIEVAYLSVEALRTYRTHRSAIGIISPGEPFHTKDAGIDWLLNWYVVREKGVAVNGPLPATFIDPISKTEVVEWVREHVRGWREWIKRPTTRNGQVYATLTLCRALQTVTTGDFGPKRQAALWTAGYLPEWAPFIQNTLRSWHEDWYNEQAEPAATRVDTVMFVNEIVDRIIGPEVHHDSRASD